jgi:regulator of protease activity HflC (stomatin/prohibitin superfamily)
MNPQDPNVPPPSSGPPAEDASSQALGEAMRSSFVIVKIIMVALALVFLGSGFFTVAPQEQAIILRLGKPVEGGRLFGPGPHWAFRPD